MRCIAFHSQKEPVRKNTRDRAGSFISLCFIIVLLSFVVALFWGKAGARNSRGAPAFMECCIKIAAPRAAAPRDIPAAAFEKKVIYFNHLFFPNCPILTVDISGLFLKNKMQGILTGLIKLYTLKSSRKISTLIFGQFNSILLC